jgi:hypothetical protein
MAGEHRAGEDGYVLIAAPDYNVAILVGDTPPDPLDDNVDVEVRFNDGRLYTATFFTLKNLESLFKKNRLTGECNRGTYLYSVNMIVVERIDPDLIAEAVKDLIRNNEFEHAFAAHGVQTEPQNS